MKHSASATGRRNVTITVDRDGHTATFRVSNETGLLPAGFSLENGSGLGTGLNLIKVLLPPEACQLTIEQLGSGVTATLILNPPVLSLS